MNIIFNFSSANSVKWFFQRRISFWLRIYDNWKGTLLPVFWENLKQKTGPEAVKKLVGEN